MNKHIASLFIVFALCLALPGCGSKEDQRESDTGYHPGSSESRIETGCESDMGNETESSTDNDTKSSTESNSESSTGKSSGKKTVVNTGNSTGSNTGNNTGSSTGSNTGNNTGSSTGSNPGNSTGSNTGKSSGNSTGSNSGSSSSGSVTPPENKIIKSVATIKDIAVDYGTKEEDAKAKLPGEVQLQTHAGKTVSAKVTWSLKSGETYQETPDSDLSVIYVGTVTIPDGYTCANTLTAEATITVHGGDRTIKTLTGPSSGFQVNYGTSEEDALEYLPEEVKLQPYNGGDKFATVTWTRKEDEMYDATPASDKTVTYIGKVQIPDGYYFESNTTIKTTIETTITVLQNGKVAQNKKIGSSSFTDDIFIERYISEVAEMRTQLPDIARLYTEEDDPITIKLDNGKWNYSGRSSTSGKDDTSEHIFCYSYNDINLPKGYEFKGSVVQYNKLSCTVYIKARDDSGLKQAEETANALLHRITDSEVSALTDPDKIYKVGDGTNPSDVSNGAKFIEKSLIETKEKELNNFSNEAKSYQNDQNKSQDEVDELAEELNKASADLKAILDNNYRTGTGFTTETILFNVLEALKNCEGNSNYAYDPANQPLKYQQSAGNYLTFPSEVRVAINAAGHLADVRLDWTITDENYATIEKDSNGTQYVQVKKLDEPKNISFTVTATGYEYAGTQISLNEQVATYNNCTAGAPISKYEGYVYERDIPKLTSGKDYSSESFVVVIPMNNLIHPLIEIETSKSDRIKAEDVSGYNKGTLFDSLKVVKVKNGDQYLGTCPYFWLTAKVAQLPAVIDPTNADEYIKGKVKLSIPADAITLTQYAEGWYIPGDTWEVEADVWVYNPVITVKSPQLSTDKSKVTVDFSTSHWGSDSREVRMALVPDTENSFDDSPAVGSVVSSAVSVNADGDATAEILTSGIAAGNYKVWVKVGDEEWKQSKATYTQSDTVSPGDAGN